MKRVLLIIPSLLFEMCEFESGATLRRCLKCVKGLLCESLSRFSGQILNDRKSLLLSLYLRIIPRK